MGKASKKKRQQELQAESILNGKSLISSEISSKWSLFNKPLVHFFLIAIVGFLVYSNTFHVPFHWDDTHNIIANYKLKDLNNFWPPSGSRWFGYLTFALNYYFGGLNTIGYHLVNLTIHIFNAILVYWLVILTFKTPFFSSQQSAINNQKKLPFTYLPLFSALLFVVHPVQTQAVTYITQRFVSLATFFYLLSLVMYIKWRITIQSTEIKEQKTETRKLHAPSSMLYAISIISAIFAMKTKEISFTLPFIIAIYEFSFFTVSQNSEFKTSNSKRFLYLLPFLLTLIIIPLSILSPEWGIYKPEKIDMVESGLRQDQLRDLTTLSQYSYLLTQFRVIVTYIRLLFFPINQNLDYDYPVYHSFFNPEVFLSLLFLLLIFAFGIYLLYAKRYTLYATRLTAFGIFWFFITLSVESSIIPIQDVIFEHRLYLPVIGIIIVFVSAMFYILQTMIQNPKRSLAVCCLLLATAVIVLSIATYRRNIVWKDGISLWEDVVKKSSNKARGHNNLGNAYNDKGLTDMAIEECQIALKLNPGFVDAHINLGNAYNDKGMTDKIIEHYQIALKLNPDYAGAHNNLGVAYERKGLLDEAIKQYQTDLRLNPSDEVARNNLNRILQIQRSK